MPDVLGWRRKFGVLAPSTNTVVEPDFDDLRPAGVTNHLSRIFTPNVKGLSNETFRAGIATISDSVMDAIKSVMTCEPDYLVMGMSGITFLGGIKGADAFVRQVEEATGLSISIGSHDRNLPKAMAPLGSSWLQRAHRDLSSAVRSTAISLPRKANGPVGVPVVDPPSGSWLTASVALRRVAGAIAAGQGTFKGSGPLNTPTDSGISMTAPPTSNASPRNICAR